jgi:hypothetical protein
LGSNPFSRAMAKNTVDPWYCAGIFDPGLLYTKPSTTPPHARGRSGTTRGSSASQPPVVFRPYPPWVVRAASGRVPGPKFAAGTTAGAAGGFLGLREGQKPVGFCPLGGAHQSAWSLYIVLGHTPRRRRPAGLEQPFKTISTGGLISEHATYRTQIAGCP